MAHDHGEGHGSGSGDGGDGFGAGFRDGDGFGAGCGDGFGASIGDLEGDGFGDGGIVIGRVGQYDVVHFSPWPYVRVGCEQHLIAYWRANWREIARVHRVVVDTDFGALLDHAEGRQNGA